MKQILYALIALSFVPAYGSAQWRDIGAGNPNNGGGINSGPDLAMYAHDSCVFLSQVPYDNSFPLIWRYSASAGWVAADGGLDRTQGNVTSFATFGRYIFAGSGFNGCYRSSNDGSSWEINGGSPLGSNGTNVFSTGTSTVYRSTDSGNSWQPVSCPPARNFAVTDACILASTNSGIYRSTDDGTNWATIPTPPTGLTLSVFAAIGTQLFAGGAGIFRSTDLGQSWTQISHPSDIINALVPYQHYLFAGTDTGIFISSDSGQNWRNVSDNMGALPKYHPNVELLAVMDTLLFADVYSGMVTGTGYGYTTDRPISEMTSSASVAQLPNSDTILVYPNPATGMVTILADGTSIFGANVVNVLGESVLKISHVDNLELGMDLSKLPAGTYFVEIETANGVIVRKIVKE